MIWLSISLIICTILICITLLIIKMADKAYSNAIGCLQDLCDTLNEKFPGSDLKVIKVKGDIRVKGELKYITKNGN